MVLATVDHVGTHAQCLQHHRSGTAQVVQRPLAALALVEYQRIVVSTVRERFAGLESRLAVADHHRALGHRLNSLTADLERAVGVTAHRRTALRPARLRNLETNWIGALP